MTGNRLKDDFVFILMTGSRRTYRRGARKNADRLGEVREECRPAIVVVYKYIRVLLFG
jgi:hypothetical protein